MLEVAIPKGNEGGAGCAAQCLCPGSWRQHQLPRPIGKQYQPAGGDGHRVLQSGVRPARIAARKEGELRASARELERRGEQVKDVLRGGQMWPGGWRVEAPC